MTVDFPTYTELLIEAFRAWIVSKSVLIRRKGTQSRSGRERLLRLVLLRGLYEVILNHDPTDPNAMYDQDGIDLFVDQINLILGTSYRVDWSGGSAWWDDDNGGVWDDDINGGIWVDVN